MTNPNPNPNPNLTLTLTFASPLNPLEKDVLGAGGTCGPATTTVHWLPVRTSDFCRQACAGSGVDSEFLTTGSCEDAGFHNFLGVANRAGSPGFEDSTIVADYTSRRSMF
jgi:hypothetical protein